MLAFGGVSKSNYMTFLFGQQLLSNSTDAGHVQSGGRLRTQRTFAGIGEGSRERGAKVVKLLMDVRPGYRRHLQAPKLLDLASKSRMGLGLFGMDTDTYKHGSSQDLCRFSPTVQILHEFGVIK